MLTEDCVGSGPRTQSPSTSVTDKPKSAATPRSRVVTTPTVTMRSTSATWLVGYQLDRIEEPSQLPTNGVVLRRIFYEMKTNKSTLPKACSTVAEEVISFWIKANITTTAKPHIVTKLKSLHAEHTKLSKHKQRRSANQLSLEADFTTMLSQLFDVAHADWERRTTIPEDRQFLMDQRGARKMSMTTEDLNYRRSAAKYLKRKQQEEQRRQRQSQEAESTDSTQSLIATDLSSDDSSLSSDENPSLFEQEIVPSSSSYITTPKRRPSESCEPLPKRCIVDDPLFNAALDRTKTTTRQAMMIVTPALAAAGVDVTQISLSRSSLMEARNSARESLAANVRQNFKPAVPLVAHFDGKLLPDLDGIKRDCMPVVVSGLDVEKLLGMPRLAEGTGALMGQKVIEFVREWPGVEEHLAGLCFDTTSSNTGIHTGAITVIQQSFNRRLLFLACRHHMLEIIAAAVFDTFFVSKGPEIALFGRLKNQWDFIDKSQFEPLDSDQDGEGCLSVPEKSWLASRRVAVVSNLRRHLQDVQPREDYRELARLTLRLLGEDTDVGTGYSAPGAYHRARWMAKGIYCLKIFGFRHQIHLTKHEMDSLRRICLFTVTIYTSFWFAAPATTSAPTNDLLMLQLIEDFMQVDKKIASIAEKKMRSHLWYLSEDLAALPLFGDDISDEEKQAIVEVLKKNPRPQDLRQLAPNQITKFKDLSVAQFVTRRSLNLFDSLHLKRGFLSASVETWNQLDDYKDACKTVRALKVINDCAERAVKLATDFNEVLTKDATQRNLLYQVVEHHRKLVPTSATKKKLVQIHSDRS